MRRERVLLMGLFPLLVVLCITGCRKEEGKEEKEMLRPVRYETVQTDAGKRTRTFSGIAKAGMASRMSFRVPGTIQHLDVKVGDGVRMGDTIARLDPTDYQLRVQEAEAALARGRAEARNADATYARVRALYEKRNASRNELDAARAASESAGAAVRSIENQLALARRQLTYTRLKAPADCAVAAVPVEENENVAAGQAVAVVNCGARVDVHIAVPGIYISGVREGMDVLVTVDALPGEVFAATITEVGVSAVGLETTFPVTVRLAEKEDLVLPGMAAEVQIPMGGDKENRIVISAYAVGEDRKGRFVYTLTKQEDGTAIVGRKGVVVGEIGPDGIEILEGLSKGELVVTAGVARVTEGHRVKLWKEEL